MSSETTIRVRFCETDALGHVNNVSFLIYMEEARVTFLKGIGFDFSREDLFVVLVSASCDYLSQAYFDQSLLIKTYVEKVGNKSVTLVQELSDHESGKPIAKGKAVCVFLSKEKDQAVPIEDQLRKDLLNYTKSAMSV